MFSQTLLALAVALVLYGMYRLCRSSVANACGTAAPPSPVWQRLLLQPHRVDATLDLSASSTATDPLQTAQQALVDDIARSPLGATTRQRLMDELDAWRRDRPDDPAGLAAIRERVQDGIESTADTSTDRLAPPRIQTLRPSLTTRSSDLERLGQRLGALQVPVEQLARPDDIADPFDRVPGKDDLRAIQGIGKRKQRLLNGMGVTTLAQLAAFKRSHIERVAAELDGNRDAIEAENWVGQARALLARRRRTHEEG